jgi:tetratricopeptide (TPR) repeat protein
MICKNEKANIGALMDDVCPVLEEVHMTDTGSTDGTLEILYEKQKQYPNLHIHHYTWTDHFSEARNFSFSKAGNVDWLFWLDADDRINSNALKNFKDSFLDNPNVDCWMLPYIYSKYPDGSPQTYLTRERFVRKTKNPTWVGAIHETISIQYMRQKDFEDLKVEHNRDGKFIDPKRNLRILEKEFEKNPNEPRTAYYFAKELFDHIDPRAKDKLKHYLSLSGYKYWDDEIGARFRLAKQYLHENDLRAAIQTIEFVYHLDATRRRSEYYFIFGEVEYRLRNYEIAIDWYKRCLYQPPGPPRVLCLEYWTWHPHKRLAECYYELGRWDDALYHVNEVLKILPNETQWPKNLQNTVLLPKDKQLLCVLELGTLLRNDSYKINENYRCKTDLNPNFEKKWFFEKNLPFANECADGIVINVSKYPNISSAELARILKPNGFLWVVGALNIGPDEFNDLGTATFNGVSVQNLIKIDVTKPTIGYRYFPESLKYGAYRYRIHNLIMSAKKNAYPVYDLNVVDKQVDVYVDMQMDQKKGKINVLEFCELLDNYSCNVENADVLDACSPLLAEYLKKKFPHKKVINVDDHFEYTQNAWL